MIEAELKLEDMTYTMLIRRLYKIIDERQELFPQFVYRDKTYDELKALMTKEDRIIDEIKRRGLWTN